MNNIKIVVLDGHTLNPGDLSWDKWREYGEVTVYPRTSSDPKAILERCSGADALITNKFPLSAQILEKLPRLKYIGVTATGYNIIDIAAAKRQGVVVSNVPSYGTASVVQMTFALLLELTHRVQRHSDAVMAGKWSQSPDFCFWDYPLVELAGKTIGIIGMGNIGSKVADIATAFDMAVIGNSRTRPGQPHRRNFQWAGIPELLQRSDVVSIHCPLFPETLGLINKETLALMKPSAFLLNTSRGPIIVEEDLAAALNTDRIAGAGLDVLSIEPPVAGSPLIGARNCIITPHISWATREARMRLMAGSLANLEAFMAGKPTNVVN
ncbi:MAG TPA: D-2-hydroxyacid dehydrogenase [Puia sp.]|jgi:glycerate dehydrogenase|nr:D-2-hydroxyacid dehydrogenase [Puia sp.]